jgi:hypothetical protein
MPVHPPFSVVLVFFDNIEGELSKTHLDEFSRTSPLKGLLARSHSDLFLHERADRVILWGEESLLRSLFTLEYLAAFRAEYIAKTRQESASCTPGNARYYID